MSKILRCLWMLDVKFCVTDGYQVCNCVSLIDTGCEIVCNGWILAVKLCVTDGC